ncbi:MAG TPA: hypothetical protein H9876_04075 [Candidatus Limosilactobacillus merdipullorum]|uniref:Uncharacterized protein n=1 Tax=Candidatus Limosilactobacillus merdipullorum TaxID=2838653 RepID=A0A9D1QPU3_9LACO|nr:hypothetical protein [Candidatus Limosilactobacillus merdipullorum]
MTVDNDTIKNMEKYDFDVTDSDDKTIDLTKINDEPKDTQYDLRIKNHIVQDQMTGQEVVNSVNDLFAA